MHDLHTDNIIDPRYRSQYGLDRTDPLAYSSPYLAGRSYPSDTTNLTMPPHYGMPQHDDMISRYASYLNTEFQSGLLSQSEPSRSVYVPPVQPYTPPMPSYTSLPSYTYSEPPAMGLAPSYEMPQVYSRSENNYGARPPNYPLDYGNMERQRLLRAAEMPVEETYVAPYDQQSVYYAAPPPQQQYQYQPSRSSYPSMLTSTLPTAGGFPGKLPPTARTWSGNIVPSAYDARFPREDALSRMYATVGRRTAAAAARPTGMPMMMFDYDDAPSPSFLVNGR
ncbi:unnamed protein product [Nippostrongylus brasiliensis]|uniref:Protein bassoon (inferred by orthology to a human protein) n=1 Tax=Nippostrongylus brasiliensis TaxID=27835 RepID=A0A0N4XW07_NIPBR|nr:unnamed protein product [Nippostrongylus brasiliensis]